MFWQNYAFANNIHKYFLFKVKQMPMGCNFVPKKEQRLKEMYSKKKIEFLFN